MKQYDPNKPLISVHIPKCGGTSFAEILKRWFGKGYLEHYHDERQNKHPPRYNLFRDPYRKEFIPRLCIHGHFNHDRGNGAERYYPGVDQFITIIRDPFELHLSAYFFRKRREKENSGSVYWSGKQNPIIANNWSLEDYLNNSKKSYLLSFFPADMTIDNYQQILQQRFLFIGLTNHLQDSVNSLATILGYFPMPVSEKNISEREEPVPAGARETFIANNPLEMAVYDYVVANFATDK